MRTLSRTLPNEFLLSMNKLNYELQQVRYPDDLALLHRWMHTDHVIPQWQLNKPELELHIFFEKMLADDHQRLYIMLIDGQPAGYAEIYECKRDRIARYYSAEENDMGIHLLIGEKHFLGRGHLAPLLSMLADFIFSTSPTTTKIICEPDSKVEQFHRLSNGLGYEEQKKIKLPEKTASLFFFTRDRFYHSPIYNTLISNDHQKLENT
ncbi:GNAT family N-acetyltransferase [Pseudoalteromonas arctica]|uniref:Acetyltransferase n=1 Tax=Pseudoalteromonas arctica TaxID=394751 RepID=A0A7Y0DRX5_9GAMM|nr:GNAT family N-acetyltransferase [Pseudoalteromonas arctica]NMM39601.1 acetyltransferase [Pseudoalteromonas arctica]